MRNRNLLLGMCALALVLPGLAAADHDNDRRTDRGRYVYARVIKVQPIIRYVTVKVPVRECWDERRYRSRYRSAYPDRGGSTIVGAIIGGVIGNQFGKGHGRRATTALGALLGGSLARDAAIRRAEREGRYEPRESYVVQRCTTSYDYREEERIDGYDVTYRYKGDTYLTRMPNDPGKRIRLRVSITPVADY
ncbi:MAG: glycine zipper 2TM domain-containing protein [Proteobacteria bacterium]|nr:glycine zipper 2TM domain-containing protein [Pseudomonadota bacterium]